MPNNYQAAAAVNWLDFDTILLDMDGTILDLAFDNYFWRQLVPSVYAEAQGISEREASDFIYSLYADRQGTLDWYCLDFWSEQLKLDLATMKFASRERVNVLPGAVEFLEAVNQRDKRLVLVTNAHPEALRIKQEQTGLSRWISEFVSSHQFGVPKEHQSFWRQLETHLRFDRASTLFVDDSIAVLDAAREFGLGGVVAIRKPGSGIPDRDTEMHSAIDSLGSWI